MLETCPTDENGVSRLGSPAWVAGMEGVPKLMNRPKEQAAMSIEDLTTEDAAIETPLLEPIVALPVVETTTEPEPAKARPVEAVERVASVDVIRGFALLGILAMNIAGFAWPDAVYSIPTMAPGAGAIDTFLWGFNHVFFDTKMMTLFSMLFGAGLVLMSERAEERGAKIRGVFYRRTLWLLVIGLIHAILIWEGDVLVLYALCGFLLYPFRKLRPRTLIVTGVVFNLLLVGVLVGFRVGGIPYMKATAARVDAQLEKKEKPGWWDSSVHEGWKKMSKQEMPKREEMMGGIAKYRGPYWGLVEERFTSTLWTPLAFGLFGWWLIGGRMLIGMGLMKQGVFAARQPQWVYHMMMVCGYGVGVPLMLFDVWHQAGHDFFLGQRLWYSLDGWPLISLYGSLFVVFGHIGLVMRLCQTGSLPWLTRRLAAVGRTALSNYLLTSIFCTFLFYGYGGDYFGAIHRPLLMGIVLAVWTFQLLVSPLWLEHFRYGPFEWLWRSLTYWRLQPMLRRGPGEAAGSRAVV